jgi:predicted KAP-like P-loop ATPase
MDQTPLSAFATDLLGRQPFCKRLESFILTEHHFVEGGLVISLNAPFGSGKTTFLNMWSGDIKTRRQAQPDLPRPVVVNAWESDYCGDPLIAIIAALSNALADTTNSDAQPAQASALREAAKDIGWFAVGLANNFVNNATGIDVLSAAGLAEDKKEQRGEAVKSPTNILDAYDQKREALSKLKTTLTEAFGGAEPKAIVFIDELDRCRPDYAISYLETIKHIFDIHGIVFVLSVDEQQLQSATSVLFGPTLVFKEYYIKFAHRSIQLPAPGKEDLKRLTQAYAKQYLQKNAKRWCILPLNDHQTENISLLLGAFKLSPRQVQEVFRILGTLIPKTPRMKRLYYGVSAPGLCF